MTNLKISFTIYGGNDIKAGKLTRLICKLENTIYRVFDTFHIETDIEEVEDDL